MNDLETRLLEYWKVDAEVWRARMGIAAQQHVSADDDTLGAGDARMYETWAERKARKAAERVTKEAPKPSTARSAATYVGKPCKHGHKSGLRYVNNKTCVECARNLTAARRKSQVRGVWRSIELADTARTNNGFRCIVCREPFTPKPGERGERRAPLYCSATCRQRAFRRRNPAA
jgi:hypothetical protein